MDINNILYTTILIVLGVGCNGVEQIISETENNHSNFSRNVLDYRVTPKDSMDRSGLMYSDHGSWFAYSFSDTCEVIGDFTGPFLMTQQNGIWSSKSLVSINLTVGNHPVIFKKENIVAQESYLSHLEQTFSALGIELKETLLFLNGHTALIRYRFSNKQKKGIQLACYWNNKLLLTNSLKFSSKKNILEISSSDSEALGYITFPNGTSLKKDGKNFTSELQKFWLNPNQTKDIVIAHTFIFPEYSWEEQSRLLDNSNFDSILNVRKQEKTNQLQALIENRKLKFKDEKYAEVLAKAYLTLQNNWRIPAGKLKHQGLFPSYHYEWFHGFWSWDSWKHAVGLSYYNTQLAKDQMRAMFDYQDEDGFVVDCIYRDTTIEPFNYRDTKPPLSAWAVAKIYKQDSDIDFVREMYPKLKKYHSWWYRKRDHDQDGMCEFGSTDGTVLAAKWESGMDNAIRFDDSKILRNSEGAYSLDQESVDLNAYLYAEKLFLAALAEALGRTEESNAYRTSAETLKKNIQVQFYDPEDGWFYDTNLEGTKFIKGAGSEGWTALWANAATQEQAEAIKTKMMDQEKFYTKVPFQTMSKDHEKFNPMNGYWRGPNWLDQAYFGVKGLRNYGFKEEADKATAQILEGAEGVLGKGKAIRENYHPLTGEGLEAQNFSWSAAHIIMLLMED